MGWLEKWGLKLISTQVVIEVEVGVELGKNVSKPYNRAHFWRDWRVRGQRMPSKKNKSLSYVQKQAQNLCIDASYEQRLTKVKKSKQR